MQRLVNSSVCRLTSRWTFPMANKIKLALNFCSFRIFRYIMATERASKSAWLKCNRINNSPRIAFWPLNFAAAFSLYFSLYDSSVLIWSNWRLAKYPSVIRNIHLVKWKIPFAFAYYFVPTFHTETLQNPTERRRKKNVAPKRSPSAHGLH